MKLLENERSVLAALSALGDAPASRIAEFSGLREHTVRHHLKKLFDAEVISLYPVVNPGVLGYHAYTVFFNVSTVGEEVHQRLLDQFLNCEYVPWLAELVGEYQYGATFFTKNVHQFYENFRKIVERSAISLPKKAVRLEVSYLYYPIKYFSLPDGRPQPVYWGPGEKLESIDELESKILSWVSQHCSSNLSELARALGIPASTAKYRLESLTDRGVFSGFTYHLDVSKVGLQTYKAIIYSNGYVDGLTDRIVDFCRSHQAVRMCIVSVGSWDYEIDVDVDSPQAVTGFIQELNETFGEQIGEVKVIQQLRNLKAVTFPFSEVGE